MNKPKTRQDEQYRALINTAMDGFWLVNNQGGLLDVNVTYCMMSGYSEKELLTMSIYDLESSESTGETEAHIQKIIKQGEDRFESRHRRKDGSFFDVEISVQFRSYEGGQFVCFLRDITERKQVETALRESTEKFTSLADNVPGHVAYVNAKTLHYQYVNNAFEKSFGIPQDKIIGSHIRDLLGDTNYQYALKYIDEVKKGKSISYENTFNLVSGQRWIQVNYNPVFDSHGEVVSIAVLSYDITERKLSEIRLHNVNRELDAFVYTVSHDLRTPLSPILGYTEILQEEYRDQLDEHALKLLAEIASSADKMQSLMADLLSLSTVGQVKEPVVMLDIGVIVRSLVADLAELLSRSGVRVKIGDLPSMRTTRTLLVQIFDNLIVNALKYGSEAGAVIEVGGERNGDQVTLYVRDHGPGVPTDERDRIFEVFYRGDAVKDTNGTGIGLATVQKIASLSGGRAWVEETPGGGSTFRVILHEVSDKQSGTF